MPIVQPGQQNQRPGGRRSGTGPMQQTQPPHPLMQPQVGLMWNDVCLNVLTSNFQCIVFSYELFRKMFLGITCSECNISLSLF